MDKYTTLGLNYKKVRESFFRLKIGLFKAKACRVELAVTWILIEIFIVAYLGMKYARCTCFQAQIPSCQYSRSIFSVSCRKIMLSDFVGNTVTRIWQFEVIYASFGRSQ
jgi:hypothetical protein